MSELLFRDATRGDIPLILSLSHAGDSRGAATPPLDPATFDDPRYATAFDEITESADHRLVVVERNGDPVGTLQISIVPGLARFGMKRGLLENVHVRADRRGQGIGSEMVAWAVERCRERGCGVVQLTSNKVRTDAHRFYRALGFHQSHEGFKLYL